MNRSLALSAVATLVASVASAHPHHSEQTVPATQPSAVAADSSTVFFQADLPEGKVSIVVKDGVRTITSNGIPNHTPGSFPNRGNPNRISAQSYKFTMPVEPELADRASDARGMVTGVAINGVPFEPGTAERWSPDGHQRGGRPTGWSYEAIEPGGKTNLGLDKHNAHVQPTGAYHYHGLPTGLLESISNEPKLVGYAADGFPMYGPKGYADAKDADSKLVELKSSYQLKKGQRPDGNDGPGGRFDGTFTEDYEYVAGSGDLDEANGRSGVTPEYPDGTYYYVVTEDFPYLPRMLKGDADDSFRKGRDGGGGDDRRRRGGPREDDGQDRGDRPPPPRRRPPPRD